MPNRTSTTGSELFIVDNSDLDWKVLRYLHDWCQISKSIDCATGHFEIGALLALNEEWQKVDQFRILMGSEVTFRTKQAFAKAFGEEKKRLDDSIEAEKERNDFLKGAAAIVDGLKSGKIACRAYLKEKFHAKAYITHARMEVVGSAALVGSSNFSYPGLTENIELNVQITGRPVTVLQEWYEEHWEKAEDVTPDILSVIERQVREYLPFDVYARSLHELLRRTEITEKEWLEEKSRIYPILDQYQKDGFHEVMAIANKYQGAFLCDGVGLGKTFVGLMVIEYLAERHRKRVVLIVPKAARKPVWEAALNKYAPHLKGRFNTLEIVNHTDLLRNANPEKDYPAIMQDLKANADVFIIDEAHHFRNPGIRGEEGARKSHYWQLYDLAVGKTLFLLTATPVNNRLIDLQHMIELFSRHDPAKFKDPPLGIHSLAGHFRKMEKDLEKLIFTKVRTLTTEEPEDVVTDEVEAEQVLSKDDLFRALVVQRSRAYVKKSQEQYGGSHALFPERKEPQVVPYSVKKTYGNLLKMVDQAFSKEKPLFSLALYYPLAYYKGPDSSIDPLKQGRQKQVVSLIRIQFLKRFESSAHAFGMSCEALLLKLLAWIQKNEPTGEELRRLERWKTKHGDLINYVAARQRQLWGEEEDEEQDDDIVPVEMVEKAEKLPRDLYKVDEIINETIDDLHEIADFLVELRKFKPAHDDKLKALIKLLKTDSVLKKHKVLVFSEFMATARYLSEQLTEEGFDGVDEVDSATDRDRGTIIRQFAPYYNDSTSEMLAKEGLPETRILISTDVLSEGLNLQDATRVINYDLHWNPVRLMQRIGRVDRRLNPQIEKKLLADHPDQKDIRGTAAFWNFLPPDELDELLKLYGRVSHKVLRISKTFGIEGKKLLTPQDEYEALKDFTRTYDGTTTPLEEMRLEYQTLLKKYPDLLDRIDKLPNRLFSGKENPSKGTRAVFFCFAMPSPPPPLETPSETQEPAWTTDGGDPKWYLFDLETQKIIEDPTQIVGFIRCTPETPRKHDVPDKTLSEIRAGVEKHIKDTFLKQVQAPVGVKPKLRAWMELS
jgi:superfamily II DNA or RNA helicase